MIYTLSKNVISIFIQKLVNKITKSTKNAPIDENQKKKNFNLKVKRKKIIDDYNASVSQRSLCIATIVVASTGSASNFGTSSFVNTLYIHEHKTPRFYDLTVNRTCNELVVGTSDGIVHIWFW